MFYVERTSDAIDLPIPKRATESSAGLDLYANVSGEVIIKPGKFKLIGIGIKISIPNGYEAQIRPRSGLALKHGITILNSPGTVDSDYRGEIKVILINFGENDFLITRGDRIAQMVIAKVMMDELIVCDSLDLTTRGEGGFGHSGKR